MRLVLLTAALPALLIAAAPARAAVLVHVQANASGMYLNANCPGTQSPACVESGSTTRPFDFITSIADFVSGMSSFSFGTLETGYYSGIVRRAVDGSLSGSSFTYSQQSASLRPSSTCQSPNGPCIGTMALLTAPTFAVTQAVPEPSSWALMIAGFGTIGAALRRRRAPRLAAG